jgi:hypothetical protein
LKHGKFLFDPHDNYDYGFFSNKVFYSLPGLEKEDVLFRFRYVYKKYYSLQRILGYFFRIKSFTELRWFFSAWKSVRDGWMRS